MNVASMSTPPSPSVLLPERGGRGGGGEGGEGGGKDPGSQTREYF